MHVAFLGFGLIGGSIARALRQAAMPDTTLVAWTPSGAGPRLAVADEVLDTVASTPEEAILGADLVVLAAPPLECLTLLEGLGGPWRAALGPRAIVTDVASTKGAIVARAEAHHLPFVGGHPMAGLESTGYEASTATLFEGRPWVIVPSSGATADAVATVEALATACGARPLTLDAATHDAAVAGISHLPLVLSAALVEAVVRPRATAAGDRPRTFVPGLAAGGWRDMTRLARGDVAMGSGIAATNAAALADRIRDTIAVLEGWLADLDPADAVDVAAIAARLTSARDRLASLD